MSGWSDSPDVGSIWRSKKTKTNYNVVGHCIIHQNSTRAVLIQLTDNIHPWAIELREFLGGFEPVDT